MGAVIIVLSEVRKKILLERLQSSRNRFSLFCGAAFNRNSTNSRLHIVDFHGPELFYHRDVIFIDPGVVHEVKNSTRQEN